MGMSPGKGTLRDDDWDGLAWPAFHASQPRCPGATSRGEQRATFPEEPRTLRLREGDRPAPRSHSCRARPDTAQLLPDTALPVACDPGSLPGQGSSDEAGGGGEGATAGSAWGRRCGC